VLSVRDEGADVMEGERSSLLKDNYVSILKESSEIVLKPREKALGVG
jgi:hypothetical protein